MVFLEVRRNREDSHTLAVYIDYRANGIAKHLRLLRPISSVEEALRDGEVESHAARIRPVEPALACARIRAAIESTDTARDPDLGEGFADLRALAIMRAGAPISALASTGTR